MKSKFKLFLFIVMALVLPLLFFDKAYAFEINNDSGKYALELNAVDGKIDGSASKIVRFNFEDDEDSVLVSELTNGITPISNNENEEFKCWAADISGINIYNEESTLDREKFSSTYDNGVKYCPIYAIYEEVQYDYLIKLDPNGGKVNEEDSIIIGGKLSKFKTIDLSRYKATMDGCSFCGWGYNGKVITSIDKSYVLKDDRMTVFALYKRNTKSEVDDTVLILDANGGTIEGEKSKKYDYFATSGSAMPIFHYIPKRTGYNFRGWNAKKDGYGKNYDLLPKSYWRNDEEPELKKDSLKDDGKYYNYLTLYANWEKTSGGDEIKDGTTKEIFSGSESELKGSVLFEEPKDESYKLDIKKVEIPEGLTDENVKLVVDISVINSNSEIVEINGIKMKVKIALPEDLKGYSQYEVVYIGRDNGIKETLPATVEDGYITFETTHLSRYGIVAKDASSGEQDKGTNISTEQDVDENKQETTENPLTGDTVGLYGTLLSISSVGMGILSILNRKKVK